MVSHATRTPNTPVNDWQLLGVALAGIPFVAGPPMAEDMLAQVDVKRAPAAWADSLVEAIKENRPLIRAKADAVNTANRALIALIGLAVAVVMGSLA